MKILNCKSNREDRQGGFTLIEILIAMTVFTIGILAIATLQYTTTRNNTMGNLLTQATMLARARIERLKNQDINSAALAPGNYNDSNNPVNDRGQPGGIYTRTWSVANLGTSTSARQITVTVRWNRNGKNRRVTLTSVTRGNGT